MGFVIAVLAAVYRWRPSPARFALWLVAVSLPLFFVATAFGLARQSSTAGRQDVFLQALGRVEIENPRSMLVQNYGPRVVSLYAYHYYGTEYSALSGFVNHVQPNAPPLSMTVPIVYRRYQSLLGLKTQDEVRQDFHSQFAGTFGTFPRIWFTMYGNVFLEAGRAGIWGFAFLLALLGWLAARRHAAGTGLGHVTPLGVLFLVIIVGVQFLATYEVTFIGLLVALSVIGLSTARSGARGHGAAGLADRHHARTMSSGRLEPVTARLSTSDADRL